MLADKYHGARTLMYLGRGIHYAIAREGALKLKESSVHPRGRLSSGRAEAWAERAGFRCRAAGVSAQPWTVAKMNPYCGMTRLWRCSTTCACRARRTIVIGNTGDETLSRAC